MSVLKPCLAAEEDIKASAIKEAESACTAWEEDNSVIISWEADTAYEADIAFAAIPVAWLISIWADPETKVGLLVISAKSVDIAAIEADNELDTLVNSASVAKVASNDWLKLSKAATLGSLEAVYELKVVSSSFPVPTSCPFTLIDPDTLKEPVRLPYVPRLLLICFHLINAIS